MAVDWMVFDHAEGWRADLYPIPDSLFRRSLTVLFGPSACGFAGTGSRCEIPVQSTLCWVNGIWLSHLALLCYFLSHLANQTASRCNSLLLASEGVE